MKYNPPAGSTDPDAPYVTGNAVQRIKGSPVPAEAVEHPQREIVRVITEAGLAPNGEDLSQLYQAILQIIEDNLPQQDGLLDCSTAAATAAKEIAAEGFELSRGKHVRVAFAAVNTAAAPTLNIGGTGAKPLYYCGSPVEVGALAAGQVYELIYAGDKWQITGGMSPFRVCEVYNFLQPVQRPSFVQAAGGLIANAAALYPQAFAFLQTSDGQALCVTEAEWQAMSTAIYYTNADGVSEGWNGVGGVPKFVIDTNAGTIRVPDLRGMYAEAAGLDSLAVGGVHHDRVRNVTVQLGGAGHSGFWTLTVSSAVNILSGQATNRPTAATGKGDYLVIDNSRVIPTGSHNVPRAFGVLPYIYLGA